jgi:uncharacterized protein HemX
VISSKGDIMQDETDLVVAAVFSAAALVVGIAAAATSSIISSQEEEIDRQVRLRRRAERENHELRAELREALEEILQTREELEHLRRLQGINQEHIALLESEVARRGGLFDDLLDEVWPETICGLSAEEKKALREALGKA